MCSCRLLWGKPGAGEATYKKIDWKQIQLISHVSFQQQSHGSSSSDELPFSPVFGKSELVKSPSEAERDRRAKRCFTLWFTDNTSMMRNGVRAMWGTVATVLMRVLFLVPFLVLGTYLTCGY